MKYLRVTAAPDLDAAPALFRLVAASSVVREARLLDWSYSEQRGMTGLFALQGDRDDFEARLAEAPEVVSADVTAAGEDYFYLLATVSRTGAPLLQDVFEALTRDGLLVVRPIVYGDGEVHARLVGESAAIQTGVEMLPPAVDVTVHEVGEHGFEPGTTGVSLSDRQREAVLVALDLGYYDSPRRGTHEDVAERLGCAPSTASEHLQKAEAKLVRAGTKWLR